MADTPYATLAQLKLRMGIKPENVTEDDALQDALNTAAEDVESDTGGRQFYLDDTATAPFGT